MRRSETHAQLVLDYLGAHPGSTAREVASGVFHEPGDTRSYERTVVHQALLRLERAGRLRRERPEGEYRAGRSDRWYVQNPAGEAPEYEEEEFGEWTMTLRRGLLDLQADKWRYELTLVNRRTGERVTAFDTGYAEAYAAARQIILAKQTNPHAPTKERLLAY